MADDAGIGLPQGQASDPLMQGTQNLIQGIQQYQRVKKSDRIISGQIDAMLPSFLNGGVQQLSPDGQKLAQKLSQGSATLRDKMQLYGEMNTAMSQQQENIKLQQARLEQASRMRMYQAMQPWFDQLKQDQTGGAQGTPQPPPASAGQFMPGGAQDQSGAMPPGRWGQQQPPSVTGQPQPPPVRSSNRRS